MLCLIFSYYNLSTLTVQWQVKTPMMKPISDLLELNSELVLFVYIIGGGYFEGSPKLKNDFREKWYLRPKHITCSCIEKQLNILGLEILLI